MATVAVEAKRRDLKGSRNARRLRREGWVPGVFYLHGEAPIPLQFDFKALSHFVQHGHGLVDLKIEGEKSPRKCVLKEVQYHPVTDDIIHVDFQGVIMGEKIQVTVPLVLTGTSKGVKEGGILEHLIHEIDIECFPKDIPEALEVDISHLGLGDALHVKDLHFENVTILEEPDLTIAVVEAPRVAVEEAVTEEEEEITEPEVIGAKKEEEEAEES
ncbi:MAG: 50S ribosomal protein L25 [Calditrichaeota bacterium]|nr:MAG: 50S ribosomal protein L25 [Calditrichota bacterium]